MRRYIYKLQLLIHMKKFNGKGGGTLRSTIQAAIVRMGSGKYLVFGCHKVLTFKKSHILSGAGICAGMIAGIDAGINAGNLLL